MKEKQQAQVTSEYGLSPLDLRQSRDDSAERPEDNIQQMMLKDRNSPYRTQ